MAMVSAVGPEPITTFCTLVMALVVHRAVWGHHAVAARGGRTGTERHGGHRITRGLGGGHRGVAGPGSQVGVAHLAAVARAVLTSRQMRFARSRWFDGGSCALITEGIAVMVLGGAEVTTKVSRGRPG